jgi:prepilin-type N-terminal cleavage/methylation domain-containing protein
MERNSGFTLIELSIVLVIIGLIVGGVLVGRDLIDAAATRAQISQIEKYQTAVNTFRVKYGYLPGDIPDPAASDCGFYPRGPYAGEGDGNGVIEGVAAPAPNSNFGYIIFSGETEMFWVDLSKAGLIEGNYNVNNISGGTVVSQVLANDLGNYFPEAKIGGRNDVYVWSGAPWVNWIAGNGVNYFGLSAVIGSYDPGPPVYPVSNTTMTVLEAFTIDSKIDDGLPQSGRVIAWYDNTWEAGMWAAGGGNSPIYGELNNGDHDSLSGGPVTQAGDIGDGTPAGPNSCFDGSQGLPEQYSIGQDSGTNQNCALSFRFQ